MKKLWMLIPMFLVAACAEEEVTTPTYGTAAVERASISVSVGSSGAVEPLATVEVKSKASGEVLELLVETGDHVEQGALMVRIDPRTVRNRFAQAEASLKAALSRRQISETQMTRAESLVERGTFTEIEHEQAARLQITPVLSSRACTGPRVRSWPVPWLRSLPGFALNRRETPILPGTPGQDTPASQR